jgi:dTDP-4-dehydrorhamnose 3,5-epimerase-like enzyme
MIHGSMRAGAVLGNHYHRKTRIFLYLVSGTARIDLVRVKDGVRERAELAAEEGMYLEPEQAHAIRFLTPTEFILLKSRRYNPDDDDTFPYPIAESD